MQNSQLFHVLPLLSSKEYSELGKFLASPFCNSVERLVEYHEALKKFHPHLHDMKLTPEELFKRVFPEGKPFNAGELRGLTSKFHKAVNEFLAFNELKQNEVLKAKLTVLSLSQKDNYDLFAEKAEGFIKQLTGQKEGDLANYLDLFEMNRQIFFHPQTKKNFPKIDSLEQTVDNLDKFFTYGKLRLASEQLGREKQLAEKHEINYLEVAQKHGEKLASENQAIKIFLHIIRLLKEGHDDAVYKAAKNDFMVHGGLLSREMELEILPFLLNHVNRQVALGIKKFQEEKFDLYKHGAEKGLFIEHGRMDDTLFRNAVVQACILKKFDWAKNFLQEFSQFLAPLDKEANVALCQAYLLFYRNHFQQAHDIITNLQNLRPDIEIPTRRLEIQCYYELYLANIVVDFDAFFLKIDNFDKYLYRYKNYAPSILNSNKLFCKITRLLAKASDMIGRQKKEALEKIKTIIQEGTSVAGRTWLSQKLEDLSKFSGRQ